MSLAGQVFSNRYRIERELAQGGMAEVYLAHDQLLDRPVALKVLFPEFAREPSFVERFRREAQAAANLNHPNIVAIYDWGQESGTYFIVMEHVEGRSLRQLLSDEGPLDPGVAADIAAEIASALAFAHRNGVVHRDVKPGNVLLTRAGTVKVTDFGIARAGASDGLTQTGSVMGTATYFSPEQAQGLAVDGRSDVYSVGVVLYEMVCGAPPFTGDSPVSVAYKHVREDVVPPTQRNPAVPLALEQIIMSALAKDPDHRYQSADDLRADILRFRRGRPLAAAPVTALVAEVPTGVVAGGAAGAGGGAYASAATVASPRVVTEAVPAYARPPRRRRHPATFTVLTLLVLALLIGGILAAAVTLGGNQAKVTVPNVVNLTEAQADQKLFQQHLVPVSKPAKSSLPVGTVVAQDPKANSSVKKNSRVTISVSAGVGTRIIPDVSNETVQNAKNVLQSDKFNVKVDPAQASTTVPPGSVIGTNPARGQAVDVGSTVHIIPSSGVTIPNVVNLPQNEAARQLIAAGLMVSTTTEANNSVPAGSVIRTNPGPGQKVAGGSVVKLIVSTGNATSPVPQVVGFTLAKAQDALQKAGFQSSVITETTSVKANDGKVLAENPPAFAQEPPQTIVVLTVGQYTPPATTTTPTTNVTTTT